MLNNGFKNVRVIFVQLGTKTSVITGASKLTNMEQDELKKKGSAAKLALHYPSVDLEINLEPGKELPFKPIIPLALSVSQMRC
ncbi:hypothetical protein FRB96_001439 [Tulasnella sp. 330]|nr:hypothetical protein FRB96_001439 [Tulasnella sp. 330]